MYIKDIKITECEIGDTCRGCRSEVTASVDFLKHNTVRMKCSKCGDVLEQTMNILVVNKSQGIARIFP